MSDAASHDAAANLTIPKKKKKKSKLSIVRGRLKLRRRKNRKKSESPDDDSLSQSNASDVFETSTHSYSRDVNFSGKGIETDSDLVSVTDSVGSASTHQGNGSKFVPNKADILQIILLLMNPKTRRFELLQLGFDKSKTYVRDVLPQIQQSATDNEFKALNYQGVANIDGHLLQPNEMLAASCKDATTKGVCLLAVVEEIGSKAFSEMVKPILSDPSIAPLIRAGGKSLAPVAEEDKISVTNEKTVAAVIILLIDPETRKFEMLNFKFEPYKFSPTQRQPMMSNISKFLIDQIPTTACDPVLRCVKFESLCNSTTGAMLKGGFRPKDFCEGDKSPIFLGVPSGMQSDECMKLAKPILSEPKVAAVLEAASKRGEALHTSVKSEEPSQTVESKVQTKSTSLVIINVLIGILLVLAVVLVSVQLNLTRALRPGDVLTVGESRSKCGLLDYIPSRHRHRIPACQNPMTITLEDDGVLTIYKGGKYDDDNRTALVRMKSLDPQVKYCEDSNIDTCEVMDNLVAEVSNNGTVTIGQKLAKITMAANDDLTDSSLSPWPFKFHDDTNLTKIQGFYDMTDEFMMTLTMLAPIGFMLLLLILIKLIKGSKLNNSTKIRST